ncbi:MAG TPA: hypothetical protein VE134_08410, partial [Methanomicrobiales archaeon]|nr:hypothetical protein [Methanomicrobiales archaeon]
AGKIGNSGVGEMHPSFFVMQTQAFTSLETARDSYNHAIKDILDAINRIISNPEQDPIYIALLQLYQDPDVIVIHRTADNLRHAEERKLLGNPPGDVGAETIGDQVIWEMLLAHGEDDLIVVTRDYTYKNHLFFLMREFREKTGHDLRVTEYLSDALKEIGNSPSDALTRFDEAWRMRGG